MLALMDGGDPQALIGDRQPKDQAASRVNHAPARRRRGWKSVSSDRPTAIQASPVSRRTRPSACAMRAIAPPGPPHGEPTTRTGAPAAPAPSRESAAARRLRLPLPKTVKRIWSRGRRLNERDEGLIKHDSRALHPFSKSMTRTSLLWTMPGLIRHPPPAPASDGHGSAPPLSPWPDASLPNRRWRDRTRARLMRALIDLVRVLRPRERRQLALIAPGWRCAAFSRSWASPRSCRS